MISRALPSQQMQRYQRRKRVNALALGLSLAAMAFGVFWLIWILWETVRLGFDGLAWTVFTESTPPPQADVGGLANAIVGSFMLVGGATLVGTPIGVMAGIIWSNTAETADSARSRISSTTSCFRHRRS